MKFNCTSSAQSRIKFLLDKETIKPQGLKIGVRGGGCNGFTYDFDWCYEPHPSDEVFVFGDIKIYCDQRSFKFLFNSTLDCDDGLGDRGLTILNPNVKSTCGCGKSFQF